MIRDHMKTRRGAEPAPRVHYSIGLGYQLPPERAGFVFEKQSLQ